MRNFTPPIAEDIRSERLDAQAEYEHALKVLGLDRDPPCPPDCWCCAQERAVGERQS